MDRYQKNRRERDNPSFSSTLLDAMYRSIDLSEGKEEMVLCRETTRKKRSDCGTMVRSDFIDGDGVAISASLRRACLIEKWMEHKVSEKVVVVRRKSFTAEDFDGDSRYTRDSFLLNSSSTSSDSSCGGGFSSSEADSVYGVSSMHNQKPNNRTGNVSAQAEKFRRKEKEFSSSYGNHLHHHKQHPRDAVPQHKAKQEGGFVKTKSRAMKIYGDLKKVKQPISPGGRLANFLNSLFTAGNAKKVKIASTSPRTGVYEDSFSERKSKSAQASTCSSASSFSRSCLSKTPSLRGKLSNGAKRSVRFYPVSVIVDEDCQPCGHKSLYVDEPKPELPSKGSRKSFDEDLKLQLVEKNRRVEEAARDLLKNYQKKIEFQFDMIRNARSHHYRGEMEIGDDDCADEDDDDAASYASSDLFELDNLSAIGIQRYREELPVYETTHLDTNRAIANGLIL